MKAKALRLPHLRHRRLFPTQSQINQVPFYHYFKLILVFLFIYYCPLLLFYDSHCTHNWAVTLTERKLLVSFNMILFTRCKRVTKGNNSAWYMCLAKGGCCPE